MDERYAVLQRVDPAVLVLLWCLAGAVILGVVLPSLLHALGLSRYRLHTKDHSADALPPNDAPDFAEWSRQLRDLGFQPAGAYEERLYFFIVHWVKCFDTRLFYAESRHCFACVYRLQPTGPLRLALASCGTDGSLVWTANYQPALRVREADYFRSGVDTENPSQLLAHHEDAVEEFGAIDRPGDQAAFLEAVARTSQRTLARDRLAPLSFIAFPLFMVGVLIVVASHGPKRNDSFNPNIYTVTVGLLCGSGFLLFYRAVLLPWLMQGGMRSPPQRDNRSVS